MLEFGGIVSEIRVRITKIQVTARVKKITSIKIINTEITPTNLKEECSFPEVIDLMYCSAVVTANSKNVRKENKCS